MTPAGLRSKLRKHAHVLRALQRVDDRVRVEVMSAAKKDLVTLLVQCAKAIINRQVPLTRHQSAAVRSRTRDIAAFVRPGATLAQRRSVLQRGGFLGALLSVVPGLLGGLLGGRR